MYMRANGFGEFYSRMKSNEYVEYFVDLKRQPTIDYPHVHIIHHGNKTVDIVASYSRDDHVGRRTLYSPTGGEVNAAISEAITSLREHRKEKYNENYNQLRSIINTCISNAQYSTNWNEIKEGIRHAQQSVKHKELFKNQREELFSLLQEAFKRVIHRQKEEAEKKQKEWRERTQQKINYLTDKINNLENSINRDRDYLSNLESKYYNVRPGRKEGEIKYSISQKMEHIRNKIESKKYSLSDTISKVNDLKSKLGQWW